MTVLPASGGAAVVTSTGIAASTGYYVIAVGSTTTLTLSATLGGVALTTTSGTGTGLALAQAYQLDLSDANTLQDGIYVFDVADRINLLRNGEITFDKPTADTSIEELTEIVASDYRAGS